MAARPTRTQAVLHFVPWLGLKSSGHSRAPQPWTHPKCPVKPGFRPDSALWPWDFTFGHKWHLPGAPTLVPDSPHRRQWDAQSPEVSSSHTW